MATRGRKPRGPFKGNSTVMSIRVRLDTKAELEALAARHKHSTAQEVQSALKRWVRRHDRPHLNEIGDALALLAEEVERRTNQDITTDGFASRSFAEAIPTVLARFVAKPIEPTDNTRALAYLSAETVLALIDRGVEL
jgi:hypothetical protein